MKKKLLVILVIFFWGPNMVKALEYVNVNFSCQFSQEINIDNINSILIEYEDSQKAEHDGFILKRDGFNLTQPNIPKGNIVIDSVQVRKDFVNEYPIHFDIEYTDTDINVTLYVDKKGVIGTDEANQNPAVGDDEWYSIIGERDKVIAGVTTTVTTKGIYQDLTSTYKTTNNPSNPNDPTTKTTTGLLDETTKTTKDYRQIYNDKQEKNKKDKLEKAKKEEKKKDIVFKIILIVFATIILGGVGFFLFKIYLANK